MGSCPCTKQKVIIHPNEKIYSPKLIISEKKIKINKNKKLLLNPTRSHYTEFELDNNSKSNVEISSYIIRNTKSKNNLYTDLNLQPDEEHFILNIKKVNIGDDYE